MPIPLRRRVVTATEHPFVCIGHRGAAGHAPENTLLSFETAIRLGAHWIELDVQRHGDTLLVFHDDRVERTTNGHGRLLDLPLATVRALDAGHGERIPTLDEALDTIDGRVGVNIELKTADGTGAAVAAALQRRVNRHGMDPERLLVSSFHLPELQAFQAQAPQIPVAALYCGVPLNLAADAAALGARCINLSSEFLEPALIADARARGLKVYVYTVNHPDEIARLRAEGIDGVFTDYPERAVFLGRAA